MFKLLARKDKEKSKEPEKETEKKFSHVCPDCCSYIRGDTDVHACFPEAKRALKADSPTFNKVDEYQSAAKTAAQESWFPHRQPNSYAQPHGSEQKSARPQVQHATVDAEPVVAAPYTPRASVTVEHYRPEKPLPPNPQVTQPTQPVHLAQPALQTQPSQPLQYAPAPQPAQAAQQVHQVRLVESARHTPNAPPSAVQKPEHSTETPSETPVSLVGTFQTRPTTIDVKTGDNSPVFVWNADSANHPAVVEAGHAPRLVFPVSDNSQVSTSGARGSAHTGRQSATQPTHQPGHCPPPQAGHTSAGVLTSVVRVPVDHASLGSTHAAHHPAATGLQSSAHIANPGVCAPQQHTSTHTAHTFVPAFPSAQAQARYFSADQQQHPIGGVPAQADVAASHQQVPIAPLTPAPSGGPESQPSPAAPSSHDGAVPNTTEAQSQQRTFSAHPVTPPPGPISASTTYHNAQEPSPQVGKQHQHDCSDHRQQQQQHQQQHQQHSQTCACTTAPAPDVAPDQPPITEARCTNCAHPTQATQDQDDMFFPYHYMSHPSAFGRPEPYYAGGLGIPYMMGMGGQGYGLGAAIFGGGWPGMSGYPYAVKPSNPYGYSNIYGLNF